MSRSTRHSSIQKPDLNLVAAESRWAIDGAVDTVAVVDKVDLDKVPYWPKNSLPKKWVIYAVANFAEIGSGKDPGIGGQSISVSNSTRRVERWRESDRSRAVAPRYRYRAVVSLSVDG